MFQLLLRLYPTPNPNPRLESTWPPEPWPESKENPWVYCGCSVNSHLPPRDGTLCAPAAAAYTAASTSAVMRSTDFIESSFLRCSESVSHLQIDAVIPRLPCGVLEVDYDTSLRPEHVLYAGADVGKYVGVVDATLAVSVETCYARESGGGPFLREPVPFFDFDR